MRIQHLLGAFLAALLIWAAQGGTAQAARGNAFCPGGVPGGAKELQARMEAALKADPTGRTVKLKNCHATPEVFLVAFQQASPKAGLTQVSQLPEYLSKLRPVEVDRTLVYRLSCVNGTQVIMACEDRKLYDGEVVYADHTGEKVLPSGCANPGVLPPIEEIAVTATVRCVEARIPVKRGKTHAIRWATAGSAPISQADMDKCFEYLLPGETTWTKQWPDQCAWGEWIEPTPGRDGQPRITRCSMPEIRRALIKKGGIVLDRNYDGYVRVMLPIHFGDTSTDYGFWICVEEREREVSGYLDIRHANGMITTPDDFQYPPEGESGGKRVTFPNPVFGTANVWQKITASR